MASQALLISGIFIDAIPVDQGSDICRIMKVRIELWIQWVWAPYVEAFRRPTIVSGHMGAYTVDGIYTVAYLAVADMLRLGVRRV
jgi:hypothetical protein